MSAYSIRRKHAAEKRQAERDARTDAEQLEIIKGRRGASAKERARLEAKSSK